MSRLEPRTTIRASKECCFDVSRDIDVHVASMKSAGERAVGGVTTGLIGLGEDVTWRARHFGVTWRMTSRITACDAPTRFVDEMVRGPFAAFRHEHRFEQHGDTTAMLDVVDYRLPLGLLGSIADALLGRRYLRRLLTTRNRYVKARAQTLAGLKPAVQPVAGD